MELLVKCRLENYSDLTALMELVEKYEKTREFIVYSDGPILINSMNGEPLGYVERELFYEAPSANEVYRLSAELKRIEHFTYIDQYLPDDLNRLNTYAHDVALRVIRLARTARAGPRGRVLN